ncbi:MAG TPA: alanine--tRNA ligase-related protein [Candidatus Paceibacterota bacterium]|nr:alanine--tRNA ligase-related protein [Candidatus Paceibacterota bacterium]
MVSPMTSEDIRKKFKAFFEKNGHAWAASSSLVPDDPSVLLTTAGMQQFKRYYTGELNAAADFIFKDGAPARGVASIQKCFRTSDIDEVGDETHLTFFEMLGNFSFGGYGKKEAITLAHDFITKELGLVISYASVFKGGQGVPKDEESKKLWSGLGVQDIREEGMEDVFWGPTGTSGPCGPTTEIYCKNANGKDVEIWNIVFNEFMCHGSREELLAGRATLSPLAAKGIDTGMGFERLAMIAQHKKNIFDTDLFMPLIAVLPTAGSTAHGEAATMDLRAQRVFADHVRGFSFLIADGVVPSNKGAGYILRRLMRRVIVQEHLLSDLFRGRQIIEEMIGECVRTYKKTYPELDEKGILAVFNEESKKFKNTMAHGLRELGKTGSLDAKTAFGLYESYGLPYEVIKELGGAKAKGLAREAFDEEFRKHQEISRAGAEKKFGGHGLVLDTGELKAGNEEELKKVLRLHTATHLLQQALREVLGPEVHQMGSDITPARTRFDFSFPRKLTAGEIARVEEVVNEKIKEDLPVNFKEMTKAEAEKVGALHFFKEKYPEKVKVYFVGHDLASAWSKEFCGGPHVGRTGEVGHFKIAKEEAVGAGVRRVRGVVD